ncbi:hypothetical protein CBS101457_003973 [Exobasidium rhododendri]|nr:hypothetical protein CBS101457_003973 [Exobasidium rhododendri]
MPNRSYSGGPEHHQMVADLDVVHAGWVLKKKRKKMQGYAKRYLILTSEGLLTYSLSPDKPTRDSIEIPHASVTSSKSHGTLHVDSGSSVFHIKLLQAEDFEAWRFHLRSFIPEKSAETKKRVYVSTNNGKDLELVDLSHLYTSSHNVADIITAVSDKVRQMEKDKVDQPGLMSMVMPKGNEETPLKQLRTLVDTLVAEHANLEHALQTSIPAVGPDGTMNSLQSRKEGSGVGDSRRLSVSSFQTSRTEEATFYDADADGGDLFDGDTSKEESSGAEEDDDDDDEEDDDDKGKRNKDGSVKTPGSMIEGTKVEYRTRLPAKVSGDEVSLFSMLKKNVGKDLSTISFPVSFNCPLSLLQAAAEEYEYAPDLLEKAAAAKNDWIERICFVSAFAVSGYASTKLRASRKPFNPLLGETYECVREEKNFRFIAEKVVHQPPIVATYAEGKGWKCQGWSSVKNKFWGKSLELIPEGDVRLEFDDGDAFTFSKPSSFMRNLLAGNKYLEHVGELVVTNEGTGQKVVIEFKEGNMWGAQSSRNQVIGQVHDEKGKKVCALKGKWSDDLAIQKDDDNYRILWEAEEMPKNAEDYYGFTYFAMSLNELTKDLDGVLPPSDTRLRPDQRAFEEGDVDSAETQKAKLEDTQRQKRKDGKAPKPRWFHKVEGEEPEWQYGGSDGTNYFKSRAKVTGNKEKLAQEEGKEPSGDGKDAWENVPHLFEIE